MATEVAALAVPATTYESHHWLAQTDGMSSRAQLSSASGPYESSVPARIADHCVTIPSDLGADVDEATAALARFDLYASAKLGGESPTLGPMSSILLRTESASSSQIENLTVGARQLALAEIDQAGSENARVVVANVRTMESALVLADHLDENAILAMHARLLGGQRGWEDYAGTYRGELVWVGRSRISPRGASHVAPQAEHVPEAMADLVRYLARDDVPVIVQAAIAHAQFETIHPFLDGNGRMGRLLIAFLLCQRGVLIRPLL